jgi:hypothetical protein
MDKIHIILFGIIILMFFYFQNKTNNLEKMTATTDIRATVKEVYKADVQAIKNLGDFASTFLSADKKELNLPFEKVNITGSLNVKGDDIQLGDTIRLTSDAGNSYLQTKKDNGFIIAKWMTGDTVPLTSNQLLVRPVNAGVNKGHVRISATADGENSRGLIELNGRGDKKSSFWQEGNGLHLYNDHRNTVLHSRLQVENDLEVKGTQFTMPTQGLRISSTNGLTHIQTQRGGISFERWGGDWARLPVHIGSLTTVANGVGTGALTVNGPITATGVLTVNGPINATGNIISNGVVEGNDLQYRRRMCNKNIRCFTTTADFNRNPGAHNELQHA